MELSHGSGTCLPQESKSSGTLSGSKAETNYDAASTSRSRYDNVTLIPLEHKRNGGYVIGAQAEWGLRYRIYSRSKSIQPTNLDLAFDKSNVDDQKKLFLLKNKWDIPSSFVFPLTDIHGTKRHFNRSWFEKYQKGLKIFVGGPKPGAFKFC